MSTIALVSFAVLVIAPASTLAVVTLELRPVSQFTVAGQQAEVEIYAVADPDEPVGLTQIVLSWDASFLTLTGSDGTGAHPWASASFPGGGLNTDFADGDAFFFASVTHLGSD